MIENAGFQNRQYWRGFDFAKGILIIIVFLGHVIPGVLRETYPRYLIYSFHMPLFIGISGFLLNIEKLDTRVMSVFKKYWKRMICPWLIAVTVFFIAQAFIGKQTISVKSFLHTYFVPYYHLWYVLGFLSYLVISCVLWSIFKNNQYKWVWIFIVSAIISFVSKWELPGGRLGDGVFNKIYEIAHYDFRIYNLLFFMIGIYLRYKFEHRGFIYSSNKMEYIRVLSIISVICVSVLFFFNYDNIEKMMFFIMNSSLVTVLIYDCVNQKIPESKIIEFIGSYSLPIYLYHVMCKLIAIYLCSEGTPGYYVISVASLIIGCILVYYLRHVSVINTVLFGSTTSTLKSE